VALNRAEGTKRIRAGYAIRVVEAKKTSTFKKLQLYKINISLSFKNVKKRLIFLKDIANAGEYQKCLILPSNMKLLMVTRTRTWN